MPVQKPKCPVCSAEIKYLDLFLTKNKPTYTCRGCKKKLDIMVSDFFKKIGIGVCLFGFLVAISCILFLRVASIWPLAVVLTIFISFFLISPFFIKFKEK